MIRVVWTEPSVSDLDNIHSYIARDAEVYADSVLTEIFDAVDRLAHFPLSGRVVPEVDDENKERSSSGTTAWFTTPAETQSAF